MSKMLKNVFSLKRTGGPRRRVLLLQSEVPAPFFTKKYYVCHTTFLSFIWLSSKQKIMVIIIITIIKYNTSQNYKK